MIAIINGIQTLIKTIPEVKYVDEDWGQLDYYSPNFPVKWPCVLIDISNANFNNLGIDVQQKPKNRQTAEISVRLTIARIKLTNSSGMASKLQKENARSIHKLIDDIHKKIQGKNAHSQSGKLIRKSLNRIKRDDGVQEYSVVYNLTVVNM